MAKKRVAVALSGGVDSAVTAYLLKEAGYGVIGIHIMLCDEIGGTDSQFNRGPALIIETLKRLCQRLDIPFHVLDLRREFNEHVVNYFYGEYVAGRTPNPCIACNRYIKFGLCLEKALDMGADYFATGHYARVTGEDGAYHLLKGDDSRKDQSYFLYTLTQEMLQHVLFPVGSYHKAEVDAIAQSHELEAISRSSQDLCFIDGRYGDLLGCSAAVTPGDIVSSEGDKLGRHEGLAFYTVGQRRGLGISADSPLYVTKLEPDENRITVGSKDELYRRSCIANNINWISGIHPQAPLDITVKIRYKSPEVAATVFPERDHMEVHFKQPQRAIAPGQSIVFYHDNEILGGGIIEG